MKAVLFDLDGTLLDTLDDIGNAMNRVLAARGCPPRDLETYKIMVGDGAKALVERALPESARTPKTVAECLAAYRDDYGRNWKVKTRPYDGVPEMLDALVARGLKLTVLSNKPHDSTVNCVRELLPSWEFDVVLGQREGIAHKPDPGGALEIARMLRLPPAEFLYLGDTAVDMQTAVAAGMFPLGALWGFRTEEELWRTGARAVVQHPAQVSDFA